VWRFGTSGWLYQSNKLMYDRNTNSLWHSLTGEPVIGELAHSGRRLAILPVTTTTWSEWRSAHPDTVVLSTQTGYRRGYLHHSDPQSAYYEYFADPNLMFPAFRIDDRLKAKDQVLAIRLADKAKAYPLDALGAAGVVNDTFAGYELVIVADRLSRAARPYDRGRHTFRAGANSRELIDEAGVAWEVTEGALVRRDGSGAALARIASHTAYWFGWQAFFPDTELYAPPAPGP
jgi:hypothetical protein